MLTAKTDDDGNVEVIDPKTGALMVFTVDQLKETVTTVPMGAVQAPSPMSDADKLDFLKNARDAAQKHAEETGIVSG